MLSSTTLGFIDAEEVLVKLIRSSKDPDKCDLCTFHKALNVTKLHQKTQKPKNTARSGTTAASL